MGGSVIAAIGAGVILTAIAFAHVVGPALFLVAATPFDAIPFVIFGVAGNAITLVPIVILLIRVHPVLWGQVFFGSRIQRIAVFFVFTLLISHAAGLVWGWGMVLNWLRFVTLFLLMGVFAWALQYANHIITIVRVMVVSMVVLTVLSAFDFYLGIQVLPVKVGDLADGVLELTQEVYEAWRFTGSGWPENRYANYLLPVIFLSVGWFMYARAPLERALALVSTMILVFAEFATVSRSGLLGMAIGAIILLPMAFRLGIRQVLGIVVIGGVLGLLIMAGLEYTSVDQSLGKRFDSDRLGGGILGRLARWSAAFVIWSDAPFLGVGWNMFHTYSARYVSAGGLGAHNNYFKILAEGGLLSFIPLMFLLGSTLSSYLRKVGHLEPVGEFWRPYFFCGLIAQLVSNFFNDYFFERYLWMSFAYAIVLERVHAKERARLMRERREVVRSFGARRLLNAKG